MSNHDKDIEPLLKDVDPNNIPKTQHLIPVLLFLNGGCCCGSQLLASARKYHLRDLHNRAIYYPIKKLCDRELITLSHKESYEDSTEKKRGARVYYELTPKGREFARRVYAIHFPYFSKKARSIADFIPAT